MIIKYTLNLQKYSSFIKAKTLLEYCISKIITYFINYSLKINDSKTDFILIGNFQRRLTYKTSVLNLDQRDLLHCHQSVI